MNKNRTATNMIMAWLAQATTVIAGLILPRLYLTHFGSETNGLIQSITQFLNYVNLLEGGLGSVFLASIYKPLAENDNDTLSRRVCAAQRYFRIIAYVFIGYTAVLAIVYPFIARARGASFTYSYISTLILILAIGLFVQFFFSLTYKLLLQGDRKAYIVLGTQIITTTLNVIVISILLEFVSSIHVVKIISTIVFLVQPVVFNGYVKKHYKLEKKNNIVAKDELPGRWSSLGQNIAFFIHNNTDITLLSLFKDLKMVSVYSVHVMVVFGLKNLIMSFSQVFSPKIGLSLAKENRNEIEYQIDQYEFISFFISTVLFGTCACMLSSFVLLYTKNITDTNYYQPAFAIALTYSEYVYCIRNPYIAVVYSAGKFKETAISAYLEAGINIVVSLVLIWKIGLFGIVIGTSIAMTFRWIYHLIYIKKHVVYRPLGKAIKRFLISILSVSISCLLSKLIIIFPLDNVLNWVIGGAICFIFHIFITILFDLLFDKESLKNIFFKFIKR